MSLKINHTNYEIFYLDYLEGNLNQDDTRLLLQFLDKNPELALEDEELLVLDSSPTDEFLELQNDLKVFDETEAIGNDNVELFMTASIEGLLTEQQEQHLLQFIEKNPGLETDFNSYKKTILNPSEKINYPQKSELKQVRIIPLYIKVAVAAAGLVFLIGLFQFWTQNSESFEVNNYLSSHFVSGKIKQNQPIDKQTNQGHVSVYKVANKVNEDMSLTPVSVLPFRNAQLLTKKLPEVDIASLNLTFEKTTVPFTEAQNTNYLSVSEMKNPIKLFTDGIKKRFDKEVDFRTAKAIKNKQGGFYLKIGRFEITRKTAPKSEDLASK